MWWDTGDLKGCRGRDSSCSAKVDHVGVRDKSDYFTFLYQLPTRADRIHGRTSGQLIPEHKILGGTSLCHTSHAGMPENAWRARP